MKVNIDFFAMIFFAPLIFVTDSFSGQFDHQSTNFFTSLKVYSQQNYKDTNQILSDLQQEEQALWRELEGLGVEKNTIRALQKNSRQEYINCRKELEKKKLPYPFSHSFQCLIDNILKDFNINKNSIIVIRYSDPTAFGMSTDFQLFLDEDALSPFSIDAQAFLIAHELQHLIQKHDSEHIYIYRALNPTAQQEANPSYVLNRWYRFLEKRADVSAAIKSSYYARGNLAFANQLITMWGGNDETSHLPANMRITLASNILHSFQSNNVS